MLADKDRIFTNLYGFQDVGLEGARRRGQWEIVWVQWTRVVAP